MFSRHLALGKPLRLSPWRKIAMGTWRTEKDPSVYGILDLDVGAALEHCRRRSEQSGERITLTHFVGKTIAEAFRRDPQINCILRLGRLYPRDHVSIFFQVATDGEGEDLSGTVVREAETKGIADFAREMNHRVRKIRNHDDPSYRQMKSLMGLLPAWCAGWVLDFSSVILYTFNVWSRLLGAPRDPMGSVMITNVGTLGLEAGFAPLVPYARVPMVIAMGAVLDQPTAVGGQVVIRPRMKLCVTFDHRVIDGVHAARLARTVQGIFADPAAELGA